MIKKKTKIYLSIGGIILIASIAGFSAWRSAGAEPIKIRQEINILDSVLSAGASVATSSEIVQLDTTQYSGTKTYYFEVVVNTSVSLTSTIRLRKKGTGTDDATISVPTNTTSYTRLRSNSFTPSAAPIEYVVVNDGSGSGTVNVKAARIIIIQSGTFTSTETQIEIGNNETAKTNTSTSTLTYPKYWYYDSSKWDGTVSFYAEVTWKKTDTGSSWSTSTYTSSGSWDCPEGVTTATIEAWGGGGGGGGGGTGTNGTGGGGGAGGQYAKKTLTSPAAGSYPYTVGGGGSGSIEGVAGLQGGTTTFNTNIVVAGGGEGGRSGTGASTGGVARTSGCVGDAPYCYAGGNGGDGGAGYSGGGGGGAGSTGTGNSASGQTAGTAKTEYGGAGATGVTGNNTPGGTPSAGYGGGGSGGTGKTGDGGNGYAGLVRIAYESLDTSPTATFVLQEDNGSFGDWTDKRIIVNASTTSGTITRTRSASFSPTSGRNYRIAAYISNGTDHSYDIYNAKIIVQQSASPTKLEPQYLLANTYQSSTGLMDFDTSWDSAEWGRVYNSYFHEISASADAGDSAKLQVPPSTDVTSSTATGAYRARSSEMTMPSANTLDVNVLNTPIYASRIIVQTTIGSPPTIESVSDHPDPVNSGDPITFDVNWADTEDTAVKMAVCKTNSIATSTQTCTGGAGSTWCENNNDWEASDPISCSYTAQVGDPASNNYWAFVCDDHPSCSTSTYGTFNVNHKPTISSVSDHPDPVNDGDYITFDVGWTDTDTEGVKMYICKTNEIATSTESASCPGTSWCSNENDWDMADPISCSYTAQTADGGSQNYWAFVCDDAVSCSAGTAGSFTVNRKPTISSVNDTPDPVSSGNNITFDVDWADTDTEGIKMYICKTNEIATSTESASCPGTSWCSNENDWDTANPISCLYGALTGDVGTNNYWAFVCDDAVSCSAGSAGSFTVTISGAPFKMEGLFKFQGRIKFGS